MCCLRWPSPVVEGDKLTRDASDMIFAQENEVVQGVLAKRPVETLNLSIRIGCVIWSRYSLDLQYLLEPKVEVAAISFPFRTFLRMPKLPKDSVVVVQEKARRATEGRSVKDLSLDPGQRGMLGDIDVNDPPCAQLHDHEYVDHSEKGSVLRQEIACKDLAAVVLDECPP